MDNLNKIIVRTLLFILMVCLGMLFVTCTHVPPKETSSTGMEAEDPPFTWEGELDPNEFDKWEVISVLPDPYQSAMWVIIQNPDPEATIEKVALLVDVETNLLGYRYFKHGLPYSFWFDDEQNKYIEYKFTQEERTGCMECHTDQSEKYRRTPRWKQSLSAQLPNTLSHY